MKTKMKLAGVVMAAAGLVMTAPAVAEESPQGPPPVHGHMLVVGLQFDEAGQPSFRRCVDVANNRPLALHAHHDHFHGGRAGDALRAAGNFPVPTAPLTPWANCAALEAAFGA